MKRLHPSKAAYQEKCPRFKSSSGTSEAAERGTLMHKAMETGSKIGLEPEEIDAVILCERYVENLVTQPTVKEVHREVPLRAMQLNRQVVEGTADLVVVHDNNSLDVVDYKFGLTAIEDAETNLQGQCYALGAIKKWLCPFVRVHFLMPRQSDVSVAEFYPEDVDRIRLRLLTYAAMQRKKRRPFVPNEFSCTWCENKGSCPGLARRAVQWAARRRDLGFPIPNILSLDMPVSPEVRGQLHSLACVLEDWTKQIKKANAEYLVEHPGVELPGYMLVSRRGNRTLVDTLLVAQFLRRVGADDDRILAGASLKVSEVEAILVEQAAKPENRGRFATEDEWVLKAMESLEELELIKRGANVSYLKQVKVSNKKELERCHEQA